MCELEWIVGEVRGAISSRLNTIHYVVADPWGTVHYLLQQ
jgi:hypothetical protein